MKVGQFVEWDSSGGTARGKITQIVEDGEVSGLSVKITGTPEEPAAKIQIYKENSEGDYKPTDTYVGHKVTELRISKSLAEGEMMGEVLTPRQMALTSSYIAIADTYGKFGWGTDSEGSHYTPAEKNPFKAEGLVCKNCALYAEDSQACAIVSGVIEPEAICKFWVIENYELGTDTGEVSIKPMEAEAARYADIDFSPPDAVKAAAKSGLALHEKGLSGNGLEPATVLWARKYVEGQPVSPERARMGNRFYGRNARFANAPKDSPAWVSWQLWGGAAGKSWFSSLVKQMDTSEKKKMSKSETQTKASVHGFMRMAESNMTNPLLKEVELVLTDFEANANKEGISQKESANIIRTALHTPIKIAVSDAGYAGHKGAIPVGPIIAVYEDTHDGKPVIKAKAVIWSDEFKDVYSLLKSQAGEREYIGTSWEVYYESADTVDGVNWLNNVTFAGTCIVDVPAYGERTKLLKVAENQMEGLTNNSDTCASVVTKLLAETVHLYYKAHASHWNVTSMDFPQYHEFFGELYEALFEEIDPTAEFIRSLGVKAPATIMELTAMMPVDNATGDDSIPTMLQDIYNDLTIMLSTIMTGILVAGASQEFGVQNYLQDRMAMTKKFMWQLSSSLQPDQDVGEPSDMVGSMPPTAGQPMDMSGMASTTKSKVKLLENQLRNKEKELDDLRKENDAYKAEADAKAQAEKRQNVADKLSTAGFSQAEIDEKLEFYLQLPEESFEKILGDFVKTRAEASKKGETVNIPNLIGSGTSLDSKAIASGLKELFKKK